MTVPFVYECGVAVFSSVNAGDCTAVTVCVSWLETTGVVPNKPCPVALLVIEPLSRSDCLIV